MKAERRALRQVCWLRRANSCANSRTDALLSGYHREFRSPTFTPSMTHTLHSLAAYCGIADGFHDIWAHWHPASDDTRRTLLAAMDLPVDRLAPDAIRAQLEEAEWLHPLPPVKVVRCGEALRLELNLPRADCERGFGWRVQAEDGGEGGVILASGRFTAAHLHPLGERNIGGQDFSRRLLELPSLDLPGYHRLLLDTDGAAWTTMPLIVAPAQSYLPPAIRNGGRVWGPAVQLYGLRSHANWGIGDFGDLRRLVGITGQAGGDIVGLNPLHALFSDNPAHISPYSPSSRAALNTLYLDVEAMPEYAGCAAAREKVASPEFQARLRELRSRELVDYPAVAAAKREVIELLWQHFCSLPDDSPHVREFRRYRAEANGPLQKHALFEALQAHFRAQDERVWGWPAWPEAYRDPQSPAVAAFAAEHAAAVDYFAWLQWSAEAQLTEVAAEARRCGLAVGLYTDLAVGANPGGAEAWCWQGVFASCASTGAPPDDLARQGQDWGLHPFIPRRLRETAYAPFIEVLRENMKHAGAIRIDHAMSMQRLFWVPGGGSACHGVYVDYPFADLLAIVALESWRNECLVIGEDLGTVPDGFRERLAAACLLSYRPFIFARRHDGSFARPGEYPRQALVTASTHDLPTLTGFWAGADLDAQAQCGLFPSEEARERFVAGRAHDRWRVLELLASEGLLPESEGIDRAAPESADTALIAAIHRFLARTPSEVLVVQAEDLFGSREQANLPGTQEDLHPNWSRRIAVELEDWSADQRFQQNVAAICQERGTR